MSGIITEYDMIGDLFVAKYTQDVESVIDQNKAERNAGVHDGRKSNMRKVASIPLVMVEKLKNRPMSEGGPIDLNLLGIDPDHTVRFNKWLNDRDNQAFRTNSARQ